MYGAIEQASRRWRGGGRDAKLIAARRRLAEIYDREDHERDVEAGVPVTMAAATVNASVPADATNATRVLITESVNSPSTRRPREAVAAARSMCGVRGAAFLLVGRLL